jgi:hypothetical protein
MRHYPNVRYWHLADIWKPPMNVRFSERKIAQFDIADDAD